MNNLTRFFNSFLCFYILKIILFPIKVLSQNCVPFGVNVGLGDYFQLYKNKNDYTLIDSEKTNVLLYISYVTIDECADSYLLIEDNTREIKINSSKPIYYNSSGLSGVNISAGSVHFTSWFHTVEIKTSLKIPIMENIYYTLFGNSSANASKQIFRFRIPDRDKDAQTIILVGNMDVSSNSNLTLTYLKSKVNQPLLNQVSAFIYTGSMGLGLQKDNFTNGINFLKEFQKISAFWPTMPTGGALDTFGNYSFVNDLFPRSNFKKFKNFFYSYNLGRAHIIQININFFFEIELAKEENRIIMMDWLNLDLANANQSSNRKERPWIIVYGFNSFYCSDVKNDLFCGNHTYDEVFEAGFTAEIKANLTSYFKKIESMFISYLVDLYISGSINSLYERLPPLAWNIKSEYTSKVSPDINNLYIVNPEAPVYVVEAIGGNADLNSNKYLEKLGYTLVQSKKPGYGIITIYNSTVLKYEHKSSDSSSSSDDDTFYLISTKAKWPLVWEDNDKQTFIISFIVFVMIGSFILVIFMLSLE